MNKQEYQEGMGKLREIQLTLPLICPTECKDLIPTIYISIFTTSFTEYHEFRKYMNIPYSTEELTFYNTGLVVYIPRTTEIHNIAPTYSREELQYTEMILFYNRIVKFPKKYEKFFWKDEYWRNI